MSFYEYFCNSVCNLGERKNVLNQVFIFNLYITKLISLDNTGRRENLLLFVPREIQYFQKNKAEKWGDQPEIKLSDAKKHLYLFYKRRGVCIRLAGYCVV